ncbi:MAG: hypothetical protein KBD78_00520 [Oligoflexales bacterium]|nr:hypothetical protein [Oligoflexales bacterium]
MSNTSQKFIDQAFAALRHYYLRSLAAIDAIDLANQKSLDEILRKRTAAFHNFRVADALLLRDGIDVSLNPELQEIWMDIRAIDLKLKDKLAIFSKIKKRELNSAILARKKIQSFHSGTSHQNDLQLEV